MKIHEYYRETANINLNGSIASLIPTILIVVGNLSFINNREIMLLTIPFLIYSLISFQLYLFRMKQSIAISRKMTKSKSFHQSFFEASHLLVLNMNTHSSKLLLYFPNGHLAGMIKRYRGMGLNNLRLSKVYALYNSYGNAIGFFVIKHRKVIRVEVYDQRRKYLGMLRKRNQGFRKSKKELFDEERRYVGAVEGSAVFMDEQVVNNSNRHLGRLRRGWMPLEWSPLFPEPNTPVLSFRENLSEEDKLLRMSLLINEFVIER
ncbi:hypothetical protein [Neobacillus soli]|uniref:hypothetical protein n=1 Tax=Neobacillus soli TaxID=220688 RepID=UPI000824B8AA|nr:hypothetical protein [Neobacillus soli]